MAFPKRKQLPVYAKFASDTAFNGAASDAPDAIPVLGYDSLVIFCSVPTGNCTIVVQEYNRGGTATTIATLTATTTSPLSQAITLTAELVKITVTNAVSQSPEILVKLV
jgi:uncharacterized protein YccT (UPF0319 family)